MKKQARISCCFLGVLALLATTLLSGCSPKISTVPEYVPVTGENVASGTVASDGINELVWDEAEKAIFFYNTVTGTIWSSIPYDFYLQQIEAGYSVQELKSPIHIQYYAVSNRQERLVTGYEGAILDGAVSSTLIEDGIRVEYDFSDLEICVPVEYTLSENNLKVRLDIGGITEGEKYKVLSVSLAPYMASAPEDESSYLFVPSGSGALLYTDVRNGVRQYSEPVFGEDTIEQPATITSHIQGAPLPVFGVSRGQTGLLGIITKGAALASIEAKAGDERIGWSGVYATFKMRGSDVVDVQNRESLSQKIKSYSTNLVDLDSAEVCYQMLDGDDADYVGMARTYRQWLVEKQGLDLKTTIQAYAALEFLGGATVQKQVFGVSYDKLEVATSLSQVQHILETIEAEVSLPMATVLSGFGKGGMDPEYMAGGYQIDPAFGSEKELSSLKQWTESHQGTLLANVDLLYFRKNGYGVSSIADAAYRANNVASKRGYYSVVTNRPDQNERFYTLVRRDKLFSLGKSLLEKFSDVGTTGVALNSLGSIAYSDYRNEATYAKSGIENDVQSIIELFSGADLPVMSGANSYAVLAADIVWNTPFSSSRFDVLDEEVPFYQMVFRGYVPLTSPVINQAADPEEMFLKALSLGVSPAYSICATYPDALRDTLHTEFATGYWDGYREMILEQLKIVDEVLPLLGDAVVTGYTRKGDLTLTEFGNGVKLYVNHGETTVNTEAGVVRPSGYLLDKGE